MRTSRGITYELARLPFFDDTEYGSISTAAREAAVAATLAHTQTATLAALEAGGFDRTDIHLSRTSLTVSEEQWSTLTREFAGLLERIEALQEEAAQQPADAHDGSPVNAGAILMLFERAPSGGGRSHGHDDDASFSADEALDRSWSMCEDMLQSLTSPRTDWALVASMADQLRVVAAAAHAAEARTLEARPRARARAGRLSPRPPRSCFVAGQVDALVVDGLVDRPAELDARSLADHVHALQPGLAEARADRLVAEVPLLVAARRS